MQDSKVNAFGEQVREARTKAGLSLSRLSAILEVTGGPKFGCTYISQIERGLRNPPRSEGYVRSFAEALEVDHDWLMYCAGRIPEPMRGLSQQQFQKLVKFAETLK